MPPTIFLNRGCLPVYYLYDGSNNNPRTLIFVLKTNTPNIVGRREYYSPLLVDGIIFMATEDGSFGFAYVDGLTLHLWSRQLGIDGFVSWTQHRVVDLEELLFIQDPEERIRLPGSVESTDIIFVSTDFGIHKVNLKSLHKKKLCKRRQYCTLIPYMSFYHPPYHQPEWEVAEREER